MRKALRCDFPGLNVKALIGLLGQGLNLAIAAAKSAPLPMFAWHISCQQNSDLRVNFVLLCAQERARAVKLQWTIA